MASINDRQVRWYDPITGKQRTKTLSDAKAAKRWAERMDRQARQYRDGDLDADQLQQAQVRVIPITELLDRYTDDLDNRDISDGHRRDLLGNLDRALTSLGVQDVRDLTKERVRRYLNGLLKKGLSARSHNAYRSALIDFCNWAVAFDHIRVNPVVSKPKNHDRDRRRVSRALTVAEVDALLRTKGEKVVPSVRRALYLFRVRTGLRCKEASRVRWSDIDLRTRTLQLHESVTKNGKPDMLPLADDLCDALVGLQGEALKSGNRLGDRPFPQLPDRRTWGRDLTKAGVAKQTAAGQADLKCLRRTFDSMLLHAGVDPIDVTVLMRHRPPGGMELTLGVYGDDNALLKRKRAAVDRMLRWVEKQRKTTQTRTG